MSSSAIVALVSIGDQGIFLEVSINSDYRLEGNMSTRMGDGKKLTETDGNRAPHWHWNYSDIDTA